MAESEIKYYDGDDLTKENSYYAQLIFRILRKDGNKITKFNKDNHLILKIVQDVSDLLKDSDEIQFERAKIEVSIKIAARNERDEVFTIEKFIKDDTGDFYAGD